MNLKDATFGCEIGHRELDLSIDSTCYLASKSCDRFLNSVPNAHLAEEVQDPMSQSCEVDGMSVGWRSEYQG